MRYSKLVLFAPFLLLQACMAVDQHAVSSLAGDTPISSTSIYTYNSDLNECINADGTPGYNMNKLIECGDVSDKNFQAKDLSQRNLKGASFSRAILIDANLRDADLTGANLESADLTGADLTGAKLFNARISNAKFSSKDTPVTNDPVPSEGSNDLYVIDEDPPAAVIPASAPSPAPSPESPPPSNPPVVIDDSQIPLEQQVSDIRKIIAELKETRIEPTKEIADFRSQIAKIQDTELSTLNDAIAQLKVQINDLKKTYNSTDKSDKNTKSTIKADINKLEDSLKNLTDRRTQVNQEIDQIENNIKPLKLEVTKINDDIKAQRKLLKAISTEIKNQKKSKNTN